MHTSPHNRHILAFTPLGQASALQNAVNKYVSLRLSYQHFCFPSYDTGGQPQDFVHTMQASYHGTTSIAFSILLKCKGLKNTFTHKRFVSYKHTHLWTENTMEACTCDFVHLLPQDICLESDTDPPILCICKIFMKVGIYTCT